MTISGGTRRLDPRPEGIPFSRDGFQAFLEGSNQI